MCALTAAPLTGTVIQFEALAPGYISELLHFNNTERSHTVGPQTQVKSKCLLSSPCRLFMKVSKSCCWFYAVLFLIINVL